MPDDWVQAISLYGDRVYFVDESIPECGLGAVFVQSGAFQSVGAFSAVDFNPSGLAGLYALGQHYVIVNVDSEKPIPLVATVKG